MVYIGNYPSFLLKFLEISKLSQKFIEFINVIQNVDFINLFEKRK